jgi:DNA-binding response OmpR family regulator
MKDGKHVILCIDDDQDFLDSMQIIIETGEYVFECANSAEEGLRRASQLSPDLIVVDLMMEEVDAGVNFVKELKVRGGTTPVFMLSSVGDNLSVSTDYSELGLSGVFQKPVDPETLLSTLKKRLS